MLYDPMMRFGRALRVVGYLLLGVVFLPTALDLPNGIDAERLAWIGAYAVFGLAFHVGASAPDHARRRRLVALGTMIPSMLAMAAILPCHFGSMTLVIVASQAALVLAPAQTAILVAAQSVVLGFFLVCSEELRAGIAAMIALVAGEVFAAVAVHTARSEAEARAALARANAELRATRSLLEEAIRLNERTRIARELHDVLGHDLTALGLQLEVVKHVPPDRACAHINKAQEVSSRLLHNVRDVVGTMRTARGLDLASALRKLVESIPELRVHLAVPDVLCVDDGARGQCILRCVQEIVTNTLRHARATNLWITVAQNTDAIRVEARDDGCGASVVRSGHGLSGMRARLEELGGRLHVAAESSRAFVVSAWLPARETPS
jgi:signal transduction histidine kinase